MVTTIQEANVQFEKTLDHIKEELGNIRTGRANPSLVENVLVDYYGTKTPLQHVASISAPEAKLLIIQPWDKGVLKEIEKALQQSQLGINPVNDGSVIRIPIPTLTEERRKEMAKLAHQKAEEAKVRIRSIREELWKSIKSKKNDRAISEDDMFQQQKDMQKVVDDHVDTVSSLVAEKEKEIMSV